MAPVIVDVEYCGKWGYEPKFKELSRYLAEKAEKAEVTGRVGRSTSFEVTINGQLVFSKLKIGKFPKFEDVQEQVQRAQRDEPLSEILDGADRSCVIM